MDVSHTRAGPVTRLGGFVHHQLIWFLLASYALAAVAPAAGLAFRQVRVAAVVTSRPAALQRRAGGGAASLA
jgi:hypothetical protein